MKKIYSLLLSGLFVTAAIAQQVPMKGRMASGDFNSFKSAKNGAGAPVKKANSTVSGYIDYGWNDADDAGFVWNFNSTFTGADTNMNYVGVAQYPFNAIIDYADNVLEWTFSPWQYPANFSFKVDTIFAVFTHENNSGQYDKLTMQIVQLDANNALTANATVLAQVKDSTNTSLSPSGNWLGQNARYVWACTPNFTTQPGQKIGFVFKYVAPKMDTLGMQGTFVDDGNAGNNGTTNQAQFATSFMAYPPFIPTPTTNRTITTGGAGNYIENQNWNISCAVTFDDAVFGISDNGTSKTATLYQTIPNPSKGVATIKYDIAQNTDVTIEVVDIAGRNIMTLNEGAKSVGKHKVSIDTAVLENGVYFYTLKTSNGVSLTKKMIVAE